MTALTMGSLCTGYGGLDAAVRAVFPGIKRAWVSDTDPFVSRFLDYRYPKTPNIGDFTYANWELFADTPDILVGGYPCQPFSQAGLRKGSDDERHLWPYIRDAIRVLRPRFTILENVAGHRRLGFPEVLADLAEDGLHARWVSVRASDAGAPHLRDRLFFLVTDPSHPDVLDLPELPPTNGGIMAATPGMPTISVTLPTPAARDSKGRSLDRDGGPALADVLLPPPLLPTPRLSDVNGASEHGTGGLDLRTTLQTLPTPMASDGSGGGVHPDRRAGSTQQLNDVVLDQGQWAEYAPAIERWEEILGRPAPPPTVKSRRAGPYGGKGSQVINPAFSEWMMGLPAGWVTKVPGLSKSAQLRILGNGVVPQQAELALRLLFYGEWP